MSVEDDFQAENGTIINAAEFGIIEDYCNSPLMASVDDAVTLNDDHSSTMNDSHDDNNPIVSIDSTTSREEDIHNIDIASISNSKIINCNSNGSNLGQSSQLFGFNNQFTILKRGFYAISEQLLGKATAVPQVTAEEGVLII